MALSREEVEVQILANYEQLTKGIADINTKLDDFGKKAPKAPQKVGYSFLELKTKVETAYNAIKGMVSAYVEDEKASAKLNLALRNNTDEASRQGKTVAELAKEYKDFATEQQKATGIGDEMTVSLMGTLAAFGVMPKDLKRVTSALQDMEAATGMSAQSMARAWARLQEAPEEALGALTRAGVKIRAEQLAGMNADQQRIFILEKLEKAFGGQAKAMADATGGIAQAEAAFGDFLEVMGKVLVTIAGPFIKVFTQIVTGFNNLPGPIQFAIVALGGLGAAFYALQAAGITSFTALTTAVRTFLATLGPIGWIVGIVGTITAAYALLSSEAKTAEEINNELNESFKKTADNKKTIQSLNEQTKSISGLKEGTKEYQDAVSKMLSQNPQLVAYGVSTASTYAHIKGAVDNLAASMANLTTREREQIASAGRRAQIQALSTISDPMAGVEASQRAAREYARAYVATFRAVVGRELNASEFQLAASVMGALPTGRGDYRGSALAELQLLQRSSQGNVMQSGSGVAAGGGGGGGSAQARQDTIDLWKLRIDLMQDEFDKREALAIKATTEEEARIKSLNISEDEKNEAIQLNQMKFEQEYAQIQKDRIDAEKQARLQAAQDLGIGINKAMSIGTAVIKKDWSSAFGEFADTIVPGVGGAFVSVVNTFGELFATKTESSATYFERTISKAIANALRGEEIVGAFNDLVGKNTDEAARISSESALAAIEGIQNALYRGKYGFIPGASKIDFFGLDPEAVLSAFAEIEARIARGEVLNPFKELQRLTGIEIAAVGVSWKQATESITKGLELVKDFQASKAQEILAKYTRQLKDYNDLLRTGRITQEEYNSLALAQYDSAIEALQGVAGAEELILDLEEERYKLLQKQGDQLETNSKYMQDTELQRLIALQQEIERKITTGELRRGTYEAVSQQQAVLQGIISNLRGQGASPEEVFKYEEQLANLMGATLGAGGFAALAGTGAPVTLPSYASAIMPWQTGGGSILNNRNTANNITLQTNLPPDFSTYILREIQRQSGRNILQGAY